MPRKSDNSKSGGIRLDVTTVLQVVGFLIILSTILWKGGGLQADLNNLQKTVDRQQTQLEKIQDYFRK